MTCAYRAVEVAAVDEASSAGTIEAASMMMVPRQWGAVLE
jgi:hypothetical protein